MMKVMYNDKLVYNVYIWVLFGIIFGKEKEALKKYCGMEGIIWRMCLFNMHLIQCDGLVVLKR